MDVQLSCTNRDELKDPNVMVVKDLLAIETVGRSAGQVNP